ncbi:MAG TPA: DUF4337 domain-containing protein [Vicinamibacterales bacterium]|nr:DUF4337 domain-containing protein [Vicinamibacterales bacterium]
METQELMELGEKAAHGFERRIGVTMAIFAAFLAVATLMGHRMHTEEVVLQTKLADQWAYYQAKNTRSQMYANDARLAELYGGSAVASGWDDKAKQERQQADDIRHGNEELDRETQTAAHRATLFDSSEVFLEIGIVLCSIALLTRTTSFWYVSFVSSAVGIALGVMAFVR